MFNRGRSVVANGSLTEHQPNGALGLSADLPLYAYQAHNRVMAVKDSRLAVRLSSEQGALIRHAAEVEGTSITEFTVAATLSHAIDVLADRRLFAIDDAASNEFIAVLDRPVQHKARLQKLFSDPSVFTAE